MIDYDILRVPDLNVACKDRCEIISIECILACDNDTLCMSQCSRENTECLNGKKISVEYFRGIVSDCPCEANCLDGCDDCENPVCDCEVSSFTVSGTKTQHSVCRRKQRLEYMH